ncbi:MAG: alanine racemase, partial [Bacteroidetes bacterium]|nr:alanine racemase [Bacteroidota bacterium]
MTKPVRYPALLLDKQKCLRNISRMAEKARRNNLIFRPHFKTHQSALIGEWFREAGISAITVSSLWMAEYFAGHGWNDITVAFPVNVREADRINRLSKRISVNLVVDSAIAVQMLDCRLDRPVNAFVKIDAGYGRAGLPSDDLESLDILM